MLIWGDLALVISVSAKSRCYVIITLLHYNHAHDLDDLDGFKAVYLA